MQKRTQAGFVNPNQVLNQIDLKSSIIAADFGCGSGGWVLPLARKLEHGKIYALDILEEPLSALRAKLNMEKGSLPVETIKTNIEEKTPLSVNRCDLILMTNLLFQVEDIDAVFKEADRVLRPEGKVLVVDWKKDANQGPEERVDKEKIKKVAEKYDLKLDKEFKPGKYHFALVFVK